MNGDINYNTAYEWLENHYAGARHMGRIRPRGRMRITRRSRMGRQARQLRRCASAHPDVHHGRREDMTVIQPYDLVELADALEA